MASSDSSRDRPQEARLLITDIAHKLTEAEIENPRRDANLILQMAIGSDEPVLMHHEISLDKSAKQKLDDLIARRQQGCPISRLRGSREFYSLDFALNEATLDPRPDSEVLVDAAIHYCQAKPYHIADFGTGSGCLLLATLAHCPNATGIGLDISADAIAQARQNAKTHHLGDRSKFRVSDWDSALEDKACFDMILSNPPYIPTGDAPHLAKEVRLYDPEQALFAGKSGLVAYERLMAIFAKHLRKGGVCLVEIGKGQDAAVSQLGKRAGLTEIGRCKDLAGIIRVLKFQL